MSTISNEIVKMAKKLMADDEVNVDQLLKKGQFLKIVDLVKKDQITDEEQLNKIFKYMVGDDGLNAAAQLLPKMKKDKDKNYQDVIIDGLASKFYKKKDKNVGRDLMNILSTFNRLDAYTFGRILNVYLNQNQG